jgi:hypothetical protein
MSTRALTARPNGHDTTSLTRRPPKGTPHHRGALLESVSHQCFACDTPLSAEKFADIQARDATRIAEIEDRVRASVLHERDAEIAKVKGDAEKAATKQAELFVKRETALMDKLKADREAWEKMAKQAVEKAKKEADKAAAAKVEAMVAERLTAQRETLQKAADGALLAERGKHIGEKLALEEQVDALKRRLQSLTAHQRGEPAEVDLYEALAAAFPDDRVSRVVKGARGPDVIVEVVHGGSVVGKIVLDSKNHARWSNRFTSKLRSDQLAEGADFAILSSSVFPAGMEQLHLQDNVLVASPQRVVVLVHLLRRQIVENYRHKLSAEARSEKADRLYDFIMSPSCSDLFDGIVKITQDMAALDRTETATHEKTWGKRAALISGLQDIHAEFASAVSAIVSGDAA